VLVSGNYFAALGLRARAGRLIEPADAALSAEPRWSCRIGSGRRGSPAPVTWSDAN
jgi:hypothetical protein